MSEQDDDEQLPDDLDELALDLADLMTVKDVCRTLGISRSTLYARLDSDPSFPRPLKIGGLTRFREDELEAWLDAQPRG